MAQVTVRINGYAYTVGCEDGQEQHLVAMAQQVEDRIESVRALGGQSGESKLLVLAALLMADELHDLDIDLAEARRQRQPAPRQDPALAQALSRLADRAEEIAASLEPT
jgi:cell division protein ZapA